MTAAKIAVTVPRETLAAVEKRRRVLGVTRSAVVTAALQAWLSEQTMTAEETDPLIEPCFLDGHEIVGVRTAGSREPVSSSERNLGLEPSNARRHFDDRDPVSNDIG